MYNLKRFITRHRKELLAVVLLFLVFSLTGCTSQETITSPIKNSDSGWFQWLLVRPIAWIMQNIGNFFGDSYILGVIFTTIIVRTIAWPIYAKTNDMSLKMSLAQPELNRINQKYVTRKDPESQQRQQREIMEVYKKYGINPLGCLLPLLQMPIFLAMYQVVQRVTISGGDYHLGNQIFIGIDFSKSVFNSGGEVSTIIAGVVLSLLVGATMFLMTYLSSKKLSYQKNIPNPNSDQMAKQMRFMNMFMVIMMVFMSFGSNSLALYWLIGNLYSIFQQQINRRLSEKKYYKMKDRII